MVPTCDVTHGKPGPILQCCSLQVYPDRAARREINELLVHCPYESADCPWTGPLREVENHSKKCSFKQVQCPHSGCKTWTTGSRMSAHIKECAYREVSCKYCSKTLPYSQLPVSEIPPVLMSVRLTCHALLSLCSLTMRRIARTTPSHASSVARL